MNCLLCHTPDTDLFCDAFKCSHCGLVFKNPNVFATTEKELARYLTHQNNSEDLGYINFLKQLINPLTQFLAPSFSLLDYGCGPGPTLSILMEKLGGKVHNFDPLFHPDKELLNVKYDVVTSTEVVEHFKNPAESWEELINLVKPNALLAIMTLFLNEDVDYKSWWYKNDMTHIVFYNQKTFNFLAEKFNLEILFNDSKSVLIFRKK